jgi:hypothetical protein
MACPSIRSHFVSHVAQKVFYLESWNFTGMLMCSCAPGYFSVDLFSICRVIVLDLVKICSFQLVSHSSKSIWHRVMKLYRNVDQHVKLCTCGFACEFICFVGVIALDLVKISNFQFVSCVAQNVFNLESWNLTGMLVSMCSCAPWVSLVDLSSFCRVIALDLVKTISLCCVICSLSAWVRINLLYNSTVKLCFWDFACWIFSVLLELLPLT